jgi:hypothetical protein
MYTLEAEFSDHGYDRKYGIFTTLEKAQAYVKNALNLDVEWSSPSGTVTGSVGCGWVKGANPNTPNKSGRLHIDRLPVDPAEFSNDLRYGLVD